MLEMDGMEESGRALDGKIRSIFEKQRQLFPMLHVACEKNPLVSMIGRLGFTLYQTSGVDSILFDHDLESYALYDTNGNQVPPELGRHVGGIFQGLLKEVPILSELRSFLVFI
ncbi:putative polyamine oxidase 2 [Platanthera guangdongensis]|uniref:Polyamine oxidase 2 n=1 Tax=Platanthera guangdongensis TaxID=2320717 RepID=A0ABR2LI59_9ASPA